MEKQIETLELLDEAACWQAVLGRDRSQDGAFVYGVRTTRIFCRPSCSARHPRRENVAFFSLPAAAAAAGFRPCKRCRPERAEAPDDRAQVAGRACRLIEEHAGRLGLDELAGALSLSPAHLQRLFKAAVGLTPHQYAAAVRLGRFKQGVRSGESVTGSLYEAGFGSPSRLYELSGRGLGMTPAAYRRGGKDMQIAYTLTDTPLGRMLLAATGRGLCMLSFGEDDAPLEAALCAEYPAAALRRDEHALKAYVTILQRHLAGRQPGLDLPLDLQATAFQLRVWEELRRIPYGQTRTYTQVAEAIGKPSAVRAVASACASNPVSVVTPCHRVLRRDGGLGGYRWGLARKRKLLETERQA